LERWGRARFLVSIWISGTLIIGGCGSGDQGAKVKGQVLQNGKPIRFLASEDIMVGFSSEVPIGQKPIGFFANVQRGDGTFTVIGPGGKGMPAGKYRIRVSSQIYGSSGADRFDDVSDPKKPPLIAEVGPEKEQTFTIDLGKWTVTKQ
jgi:hypothetical protein